MASFKVQTITFALVFLGLFIALAMSCHTTANPNGNTNGNANGGASKADLQAMINYCNKLSEEEKKPCLNTVMKAFSS